MATLLSPHLATFHPTRGSLFSWAWNRVPDFIPTRLPQSSGGQRGSYLSSPKMEVLCGEEHRQRP